MTVFFDYFDRYIPTLSRRSTASAAPLQYGSDMVSDLTSPLLDLFADYRQTSGLDALASALLRRLITPRGTLLRDPAYGYALLAQLHEPMTAERVQSTRAGIEAQLRLDDRVSKVVADVAFVQTRLRVQLRVTPRAATSAFKLVFSVGTDGRLRDLIKEAA